MIETTTSNAASSRAIRWWRALRCVLVVLYFLAVLVRVDSAWPGPLRTLNRLGTSAIHWIVRHFVSILPESPQISHVRFAVYLLLAACLIPLGAAWIAGIRRLSDLGVRRPNGLAMRYFAVGLIASLPFLWWMSRSEPFAQGYLSELKRVGLTTFLLFYLVNMFTEHLLLHGIVPALTRQTGRWPAIIPTGDTSPFAFTFKGVTGWLGLRQPSDESKTRKPIVQRLGLPADSICPILISGALFALVHWGKDSRELLLSAPGGVLVAFVALRTNSFFTPFVLHLATAGAACLMIAL
jgi:hypothetical protein